MVGKTILVSKFETQTNLEQILVGRHRHVLNLLDQLQEDWLLKVAKDPHVLKHKPAKRAKISKPVIVEILFLFLHTADFAKSGTQVND